MRNILLLETYYFSW